MKERFNNIFISTLSNKESNIQVINILNSYFDLPNNNNKIMFFVDYNIDKKYGQIKANNITSQKALEARSLCYGFYFGKHNPNFNKEQ